MFDTTNNDSIDGKRATNHLWASLPMNGQASCDIIAPEVDQTCFKEGQVDPAIVKERMAYFKVERMVERMQ